MKIKILRNIRKEWTKNLEKELVLFLKSNSFEIVKKGADITICIGGDGTIFYFNHINSIEGSIVGIGSESSHICQIRKDNWKKILLPLILRKKAETRITLIATLGKNKFSAINDIVLHTADYRLIRVFYSIDSQNKSFDGDGIILSTPTGSTAYAYSAGGIIIDEPVEAIELVPICPYKRLVSPSIVHEKSEISFYSDRIADFVIDGIFIKKLKAGEKIHVKKGKSISFLV
ncbi:MAG: hypothetical protein PHU63_00655 [Candidatus ainarchaeum sp.]|nr:hypothetical protein [Candidatus ainarchaeum sp.]